MMSNLNLPVTSLQFPGLLHGPVTMSWSCPSHLTTGFKWSTSSGFDLCTGLSASQANTVVPYYVALHVPSPRNGGQMKRFLFGVFGGCNRTYGFIVLGQLSLIVSPRRIIFPKPLALSLLKLTDSFLFSRQFGHNQ